MKKLVFIWIICPFLSYSQENPSSEDIKSFHDLSLKGIAEITNLKYDPLDYFYTGSTTNKEAFTGNDLKNIKALFFWSTSCHYCKIELKEINALIKENPEWRDNILINIRVDFKWADAKIVQEGTDYVLYKNNKEFIRTPIQLVFIEPEFGEKADLVGNPHTFFYNEQGEVILYKSSYYASRKKLEPSMNQAYLKYEFENLLN